MSSLKYEDRVIIEKCNKEGLKPIEIAVKVNKSLATIYREFERGCTGKISEDKWEYSAELGQRTYMENKKKCGRGRKIN